MIYMVYRFYMGDIIGITHPVTGWFAKPFRIGRIEIEDDFECTIESEEYNGEVYHDYSLYLYQGGSGGTVIGGEEMPPPAQRLFAYHDYINNKIYVTFSYPPGYKFLMGANIYISIDGGSTYTKVGISVTPIASVYYSSTGTTETSEMEPTRTKYNEMCEVGYQYTDIPFDPITM